MLVSRYPVASVRQLFSVAFPLMIAAFSLHCMLLVDRIVVSHYSAEALASITLAGNVCAIIEVGAIVIASISEVFVGQYNGSKQYDKISSPVWQMIWFALFLLVITIPLGLYGGSFFMPNAFLKYGEPYYRWCMIFAPLHAVIGALTSFYIGRGKVKFTTFVVIVGNIINIVLDLVLVVGIKDVVPSFGPVGAAYATVVSLSVQSLILFLNFLGKKNRKKFKTNIYEFNKSLFIKCIKIGSPNAIGVMIEIFGWFSILLITAYFKQEYVSMHSMVQTISIFCIFFVDALSKGTSVISSNMIGSRNLKFITKLMYSGFKMHSIYLLILSIPLFFFPNLVINLFFKSTEGYSQYFIEQAVWSFRFVWIFILLDGLFWTGAGILVSGGDTMFLTSMNSTAIWIFSVLPIFIAVKFFDAAPSTLWLLMCTYKLVCLIGFFIRYRSNKWLKMVV